ncbi:MAG: hypothetical protein WC777_06365 [Candidatus Gracilibacteria bacterium]
MGKVSGKVRSFEVFDFFDGAGIEAGGVYFEAGAVVGKEDEAAGVEKFQRRIEEGRIIPFNRKGVALVFAECGRVDDDDVVGEIFALGVAEEFEGIHFVDPVFFRRQMIESKVFLNPLAVGFRKIHAGGFSGAAAGGVDGKTPGVCKCVEYRFVFALRLDPFARFTVIQEKSAIQIIRKIDEKFVPIFFHDHFLVLGLKRLPRSLATTIFVKEFCDGDLRANLFFEFLCFGELSKNMNHGIVLIQVHRKVLGS